MNTTTRKPWPEDAPVGKAWQCPDCTAWSTLGGNAGFHRDTKRHGEPTLVPLPSADDLEDARLRELGWTHLTDWTFTSTFPMESMLREAEELKRYYCAGKSSKGAFNKFLLQFGNHRGHLDIWGRLEEDYQI